MTPKELWSHKDDILNDPSVHHYLKQTICLFDSKDPVDALKDADLLVALMKGKCDATREL